MYSGEFGGGGGGGGQSLWKLYIFNIPWATEPLQPILSQSIPGRRAKQVCKKKGPNPSKGMITSKSNTSKCWSFYRFSSKTNVI